MPHIHMKVWIKNAPIIGKSSDEDILKFINQHITCKLITDNKKLNELIKKFQIHKCTCSCERLYKKCIYCRYGYPKVVSSMTKINKLIAKNKKGKLIKLKKNAVTNIK